MEVTTICRPYGTSDFGIEKAEGYKKRRGYCEMDAFFQWEEQRGEARAKQVFKLHMQGKTPVEIAEACQLSLDKVKEILE